MKKLLSILIYLIVSVMLMAVVGCTPAPTPPPTPQPSLPAGKIATRENIGFITGPDYFVGENKDTTKFGFAGTDLGFPLWDSTRERMLVFFGDTFSEHKVETGKGWVSNIVGATTDLDLSNGIDWDGWLTKDGISNYSDEQQQVVEVAKSFQKEYDEKTKIPTGAVEIDGTIYMFYFSKYSWSIKIDSMNYGGCVKSINGGNTWQRVYDLTWVNHATGTNSKYGLEAKKGEGNSAENIQELVNKDNTLDVNGGNINIADHEGYFFTQIFPIDGKDGYIYIFGEGGYRTHGIKLGRVKKENIEIFDEYEYFCGNVNGEPTWQKGIAGLRACCDSDKAFILGDKESVIGEHSVAYNPYLQKWMLTYLEGGVGVSWAYSKNIWGPYIKKGALIPYTWEDLPKWEEKPVTTLYGGFIHEKWMEQNGKVMYCAYSQYFPIYNSSIMKITFM
ncbi:MAG: DUF4185 domain-containing protein [Clostridia bacterium]|nr:DUF4185 domain-containing protein [Clostridia bacterium]